MASFTLASLDGGTTLVTSLLGMEKLVVGRTCKVCVMYSGNDSYRVVMRGVAGQDGNFFLSLAEM